jgi:subtilisin family serine protease
MMKFSLNSANQIVRRRETRRRETRRRLLDSLEKLEDRCLLAADLGLNVKPPIDLESDATPPFFYVADGRPIGLSPVSGELLLGVRRELDFDLSELFSGNPVALGVAVDPDAGLGVSREIALEHSWVDDFQPLSNRLVSLKLAPDVDWNAGLAELFSGFTAESAPSPDDFWTAPVLRNAESGLRQWVTDEVIVMLEPEVDPELFFSESIFAGYRNLSGTNDQFVATISDATGMEALEMSNEVLPDLPGVVWSTVNFVAEAQRNFTPNDPLYVSQWHLNNSGQTGASVDADIDANLAWDVVTGDEGVVIAIIDDGFQTSHPDIDYWVNPNESTSPNGTDTDGNGWIDDINGLNLVDASTTTDNSNLNNINPSHPNENHGTAVAGSAATRGNNSLGVASPAFGTKIMGLKPFACTIVGGGCFTSFESVARTVYYAAGRTANGTGTWRGADVINISYSMSPNTVDTTAFNWATANGRNGLGTPVFASTGNGASGAELARVDISIPFSLSPGAQLQFRYSKDASVSSGDDRVWINWARFPNGTVERFDNIAGPSGWTSSGNALWNWITALPETSRAHGTGRYPVRSGAITNNQSSSYFTPEFNSSGGFDFRYWISSEADFDKLEVFVRYRDFFGSWGSWTATNFTTWDNNGNPVSNASASGIASFTANAVYPASLSSVIGVGASTDWDYKSDYSQYGPGLDFVAPSGGGNIDFWTTDRTGSAGYGTGDYVTVQGTSFSSPLAAGVGALMLSRNPNLTASQLRTIMQNTAEQVGSQSYPGGVNQFYGHGRINAHQAVLAAGVDSNDRISNATFVELNSTVNGRLTTTTDVNMHRINVSAGQRISIDVDHYATDSRTDTFLRLFDSSGNLIASSDDSSGPAPEFSIREGYIEHTFTSGGNYYIGVSAFGNSSYNPVNGSGKNSVPRSRLGNYQLRVNNVSPQMLLVNANNDSSDGKFFNGVTLRESIAFANLNPGSVIQFDTAGLFSVPQTINLSGGQGQLNITADMTIDGANRVTVDAQNASRVFNVDDGTGTKRNVTITGMTIRGGNAANGGGILNRENLTLEEILLTSNSATFGAGLWDAGDTTFRRSAITNNTATNAGGAVYHGNGSLNIQESTVSGNTAGTGGGIHNYFGSATIARSTISGNSSGMWSFGNSGYAQTNVNNSIISGNTGGDVVRHGNFTNTFISGGFNIVGSGTASGAFNQTGDQVGVDPLLGSLGNNGGPTPTYTLLPGSPAINRGNPAIVSPPASDQRGTGFPRIRGGVIDIGAVESQPPVVNVIGSLAQPTTIQRNYDLRAREVVFYQFTLTSPVQAANDQFLVIDTLGTTGVGQDTEIGLYDASGNRVANSDIAGFNGSFLSRLGFGDTVESVGDLTAGTYYLSVSAFNTSFGNTGFNVTSTSNLTGNVQVNIRLAEREPVESFVNHVGYTGGGPSIDTGKSLAKESASPTLLTYDNLINSSRGINGLVFDVQYSVPTVNADDFSFQMSPTGAFNEGDHPVSGWELAPDPTSVTVTPHGTGSRIAITWPDNAIANRWLRVTVLANANTGLPENEVYYVGHLLGETTGPSGGVFTVSFADISPIRSAAGSTVNAGSPVDIDKNGTVSFADISAMRSNVGAQLTIITIPGTSSSAAPLFGGFEVDDSNKSRGDNRSDQVQVVDGLQSVSAPKPTVAVVLKDSLFGKIESSSSAGTEANAHNPSESLEMVFGQSELSQRKNELEALDAFFAKF